LNIVIQLAACLALVTFAAMVLPGASHVHVHSGGGGKRYAVMPCARRPSRHPFQS